MIHRVRIPFIGMMRYDAAPDARLMMADSKRYDVAVVGAGVFGAWTARHLALRGKRVLLAEAFGPAHSRASSGDESRIIRMGYGADELYTRWSINSLGHWQDFFRTSGSNLFHETSVLWLGEQDDLRLEHTIETLRRCDVPCEQMNRRALEQRYPQICFDGVTLGILEPKSGVLMARRAVAAVVENAIKLGVEYRTAQVEAPQETGRVRSLRTRAGKEIRAEHFIFACGAWLGKLFPELLGERVFPTRQEVFYFGVPAGNSQFAVGALPTFLFQENESYGMPDLESRGVKIGLDRHGEAVDPDTQSRLASPQMAEEVRRYVGRRFPMLRDAPIVETRVCQYENTSSGDFLIDRHPQMENVWFAGGGSGHGFKHGPAVGEYVTRQILDGVAAEPRFSLATKKTQQARAVF